MPNASAMLASDAPIAPNPTIPKFAPLTERPMSALGFH